MISLSSYWEEISAHVMVLWTLTSFCFTQLYSCDRWGHGPAISLPWVPVTLPVLSAPELVSSLNLVLFLWDRMSLCYLGWLETRYVGQTGLELKRSTCLCLLSLGLKVKTIISRSSLVLTEQHPALLPWHPHLPSSLAFPHSHGHGFHLP